MNKKTAISLHGQGGGVEGRKKLQQVLKVMGLVILWVFLVAIFPYLIYSGLLVNMFLLILITGGRYYATSLPVKRVNSKPVRYEPFVSIHVPTYNEPPDMVIKTLKSLHALNYTNYEVIVLDNNTKDINIWEPVRSFCTDLGPKFRFYHVEELEGYKAGALNLACKISSPITEFIMTVDADYLVDPDILNNGIKYFTLENTGLVQFPQAYYNISQHNAGMQNEYEHFFKVYMNLANHFNCVLSTGTLCLIRKSALEKVGRWSQETLTEDAELGVRMYLHGYQGVYVPEVMGRGLMPIDLRSLKLQRDRWVRGNMQTLLLHWRKMIRVLDYRQVTGIGLQLTCWMNFIFIPILSLTTVIALDPLIRKESYALISLVSIVTIWLYFTSKLGFFLLVFKDDPNSLRGAFSAWIANIGLTKEGAISWVEPIIASYKGFVRTNKFVIYNNRLVLSTEVLAGMLILSYGTIGIMSGKQDIFTLLCFITAPAFLTTFYLQQQLVKHNRYLHRNEADEADADESLNAA